MSGDDDIVKAIEGAKILAWPSPVGAASRGPRADAAAIARRAREPHPGAPEGGGNTGAFELWLANFAMTDLGNAERFAERNRGKLIYCACMDWLFFDGKRWSHCGAAEKVKDAARNTVREIQNEASALRESSGDVRLESSLLSEKIAAWGRRSEAASRLRAIPEIATAMLAVEARELDVDPMSFNLQNGTLHIAKRDDGPYVELRSHDPRDLITKISPVIYDPAARCPRFDLFMDEVHPPGEADGRAVQRFLDQWGGLSLTGDTSEQKFCFHHGPGRNGKSVWIAAVSFIGGDYAKVIGIESFLDTGRPRGGGQATPDLASLPGVRLLTTSEPPKHAKFDAGLLKLLIGGDSISARHLHKAPFSFTPQCKLNLLGNHLPRADGSDDALWRRLVLVPWRVTIEKERCDAKLLESLKLEASGILNRMLDGLSAWLDHGLLRPPAIEAATDAYRDQSDPLGRFLETCTRKAPGKRVSATDIHTLFCAWAAANAETSWSPKGLGMALRERGVAAVKSSSMFWQDIELTMGATDFLDD